MKKFTLMLLMVFALGVTSVMAQGRSISGKVVDSSTKEPLVGATIMVVGTSNGAYSLGAGEFTINNVSGAVTLEVTFLGYTTLEIPVAATATEITAELTPSALKLDEVVVIAYGKADKKSLTGSVATVSSDDIEARPVTNVTSAIAGTAPGIRMISGSGAPGSSPTFQIRGVGSINSSTAPLYVVDGIPYTGDISLISSDEIASMSILKDAASTALYGSKGSNGVIMITTKTGRKEKISFNVKINQGILFRAQPEYEKLGAEEWYEYAWETYRNNRYFADEAAGLAVANEYATANLLDNNNMYNIMADKNTGVQIPNDQLLGYQDFAGADAGWAYGVLNPNATIMGDYVGDLDWMDAASGIGFRQNYSITASGGSDKATYFGSVGYTSEDGYFDYTSFDRMNARLKTDLTPTKWLRMGVNLATSYMERENPYGTGSGSYNNPWFFGREMAPIYPVHAHDAATGAYILDAEGQKIYDDGFATTYSNGYSKTARGQNPGRNALYEGALNTVSRTGLTMTSSAYAEITFLKDFRLMIDGSMNNRLYFDKDYENPIIGDGAPGGRFSDESLRYLDYNFKQQLDWERSFGDHTVSALAGHENFSSDYNYLGSGRATTEVLVDGPKELSNYSVFGNPEGYSTAYRSEGYYGRVNYNYQEKYYVSASYRRDGSSKFAPENRWGDFWSVGASWIISAENFMSNVMWVDFLKARVSYGTNGNDNGFWNDRYMYQPLYSLGAYGTTAYGVWDTNGAPSVTWETAGALDLGVEFRLFGILNGDVGFYNKSSDKLLFDVPQPLYSGVFSETQNLGSMYNRGFEFAFDVDAVRNGDWYWNIGINASTFTNKITDLPESVEKEGIISGSKKLMEGHGIYDYWLRQFAYVDPQDGASVYLFDTSVNPETGEANTEWDPTSNSNQFEKDGVKYTKSSSEALYDWSGSAIPAIDGALSSSLTWKNLTLDVLLTYRIGGKAYDYSYAGLSAAALDEAMGVAVYDSWRKPGDVASLPRLQSTNSNLYAQSDRQLISNSYLGLQNVTLTYNFPKRIANKLTLSGLSVYASGENLWQLSAVKGYDATSNFNGTSSNARFGSVAVVNFGINVSF